MFAETHLKKREKMPACVSLIDMYILVLCTLPNQKGLGLSSHFSPHSKIASQQTNKKKPLLAQVVQAAAYAKSVICLFIRKDRF